MKLISLNNVSAGYDGNRVLTDVTLDIYADDFIGIIGPNGGGKTTLVKTILQLIPYTGCIHYHDGANIKDGSIGYLPQQNGFDRSFPITVREVVISGLQSRHRNLWRLGRAEKNMVQEVMEMTGITTLGDKPIGELSGGEMQKALLCRALVSCPKVLFLDEPGNYVDNRFEKELYNILASLSNRMAIVMVSHNVTNIQTVAKNLLYVDGTARRISPQEIGAADTYFTRE